MVNCGFVAFKKSSVQSFTKRSNNRLNSNVVFTSAYNVYSEVNRSTGISFNVTEPVPVTY